MIVQHDIEFEEKRCYECGSYYALEKNRGIRFAECPFCLSKERDNLRHKVSALHRAVNALKGLLKKKG